MKKLFLCSCIFALFLSACSTTDYTAHRGFKGIDYSAYERPNKQSFIPADEDFVGTLPAPSVLDGLPQGLPQTGAEQTTSEAMDPAEVPAEDEDFTSEEIAASYGRYTDVTVVAAAKRVKLGAAANSKNMNLFQKALDGAYKKALRTYMPAGFTYSIASVGAVNPLSDIEVSCILGEQAANEIGQSTCNLFFQTLIEQYNTLLKEAQKNAAL